MSASQHGHLVKRSQRVVSSYSDEVDVVAVGSKGKRPIFHACRRNDLHVARRGNLSRPKTLLPNATSWLLVASGATLLFSRIAPSFMALPLIIGVTPPASTHCERGTQRRCSLMGRCWSPKDSITALTVLFGAPSCTTLALFKTPMPSTTQDSSCGSIISISLAASLIPAASPSGRTKSLRAARTNSASL